MLPSKHEIREYTERGRSPFHKWFAGLDKTVRARIFCQLTRMENGNFGNSKSVGGGVLELRIHFGAGYRVYYGRDGDTIIILLGGGSKRRQSADIEAAKARWSKYRNARDEHGSD